MSTRGRAPSSTPWNGWRTATAPNATASSRDLAIAESQLRDYQARLGKPFPHDAYLAELTALRDQLKAGLSGTAQEPGKQEGPSVSELAERIKALKAANTIEATPSETGRNILRRGTHHRPHTAADGGSSRIRSHDRGRCSAPEAEGVPTQGSTQNASLDPPGTFQERIIRERQRKDDGPTPP